MLLQIPDVLDAGQVARCREALDGAHWADGRATAGYQSAQAKRNEQLPEDSPVARELGEAVVAALQRNPLFVSAALPLKVFPPLFNRYAGGQAFGSHVDNAIRPIRGTPHRVRTDLSATLFLSAPEDYEGGGLIIEDSYATREVKLPAGDLVLYPGTSVHRVEPVTRGTRIAAFTWIQSMVRDGLKRSLLFELDNSIQELGRAVPDNPAVVRIAGTYHNLLRLWADV